MRCFCVVALCASLAASLASAQTVDVPSSPPQTKRPRVGLVLSGGGARGFAHLGVLRVLREAQVPVDIVVGTSMGAIVGAGHASGYTVEQMEQQVRRIGWGELFSGRPPREQMHWRRKVDDLRFMGRIELGLKPDGLVLPRGAVAPQILEEFLRVYAGPVRELNDLEGLPLVFRAVATDLESGAMVVLKSVPLDQALRASMSIPGAFPPVEIDGRLLVDGGLVRNLPIDVARELGAEVVIAVNVGTPLAPRESLRSVLGVAQHMVHILTEQNVRASLAQLRTGDVLISPQLDRYTLADFDRAQQIIDAGEAAARAVLPQLTALGVPLFDYQAADGRRVVRVRDRQPTVVDAVRFEGLQRAGADALASELDLPLGQPLTDGDIDAAVRRLYGRGDFERIDYRFEGGAGSGAPRELVVAPVEKSWGPHTLRFGGSLSSNLREDNSFSLLLGHTLGWVNRWGAEWRNELQLGSDRRFTTEFFQPLAPGSRWFLRPLLSTERSEFDLFEGDRAVARFENLASYAALFGGYGWPGVGVFELGAGRGLIETRSLIGAASFGAQRSYENRVIAQARRDMLDDPAFPRHGHALGLIVTRYPSQTGTAARRHDWLFEGVQVWSRGRDSLQLGVRAGESVQEGALRLGGVLELSGSRVGRFAGSQMALLRLLGYRNVTDALPGFGNPVYVGASLETGAALPGNQDLRWREFKTASALFVGVDSLLGPVYVAWGHTFGGDSSIYLFWGKR